MYFKRYLCTGDGFHGLAKDVTASKPCVTDVLANLEDDVMYEAA